MIQGRLAYRLGNQKGELEQGERDVIPAGVPHRWGNPTEEEIAFRVEFRPAFEMEGFFELFCVLGPEGELPTFWQLILIGQHYQVVGAGRPVWMQKTLCGLLAPVAWVLGYRPAYDQFIEMGSDSAARDKGV